jgi:hypothetical protein
MDQGISGRNVVHRIGLKGWFGVQGTISILLKWQKA